MDSTCSSFAAPIDNTVTHPICVPSTILQYELDPPAGEARPRPLFAHSNLLKHISGVHQGETFTHIVSARIRMTRPIEIDTDCHDER